MDVRLGRWILKIVWDFIETMTANKVLNSLKYDFLEDREKIPSQCRIMKTFFTPISVIRGKHYSNNTNNMNYVHNNSKELVYVLITLGKSI